MDSWVKHTETDIRHVDEVITNLYKRSDVQACEDAAAV